jgi:hypothetical protein
VRRLSFHSIDFDNQEEVDALLEQVLEAGHAIANAEREEVIRKGIIDERGNLLKSDLPRTCVRADRDFGDKGAPSRVVVVAGPPGNGKTTWFHCLNLASIPSMPTTAPRSSMQVLSAVSPRKSVLCLLSCGPAGGAKSGPVSCESRWSGYF